MPLRPDRWPAGAAAAGGPAVLLRQPRVHRTQFAEQPAALTDREMVLPPSASGHRSNRGHGCGCPKRRALRLSWSFTTQSVGA